MQIYLKKQLHYLTKLKNYTRLQYPINLKSCKTKGYNSQTDFTVLVKLKSGHKYARLIKKARKPSLQGSRYDLNKSNLEIAKQRVSKRYSQLKVINGHKVLKHNSYHYFEIIIKNESHPLRQKL